MTEHFLHFLNRFFALMSAKNSGIYAFLKNQRLWGEWNPVNNRVLSTFKDKHCGIYADSCPLTAQKAVNYSTLCAVYVPFFPKSLCRVLWGSCFWFCIPPPPPRPRLARCHTQPFTHTIFHTQLCHTPSFTAPSFTHNFVTHHLSPHHLSHTTLSHTHTHRLSHTTLSHTIFHHTIFHTQLCHTPSFTTPSFTHNFVTHHLSPRHLSHNFVTRHLSPRHLSHTTLSHTIFHHTIFGRRGAWWHLPSFLRGRRGTCGAGLDSVARLGALRRGQSPVTPRHFAWQAWRLTASTFASRGRRGTWWHLPSFCVAGGGTWRHPPSLRVAGVALGTCGTGLDSVARLGPVNRRWRRGTLRGRHGAWRHPPSLRVADVALGDIYLRFAWQAWCLCHWAGSGGGLGRAWAELVAGEAAALCVAGVALGDIHLRFAWQAWHLVTSTLVLRGRRGANVSGLDSVARLGAVSRRWRRGTLRGRRGAWRHPPLLRVAGVALGDIYLRFAWQAWHLCHWAGFGGALGRS